MTERLKITDDERGQRMVAGISLGNLLIVGSLLCGIVGHFVEVSVTGNQTQKDVATLRTDMTLQIDDVKKQIVSLQNNLTPIIQLGVRVDNLEREVGDLYHRSDATNGAVSEANILAHGVRSDIDNVMRASNAALPQGPRR